MASVNGEYVGPLNLEDVQLIVEDLEAGRPVLEHKQLRYRAVADPNGRVSDWNGLEPVGQEGGAGASGPLATGPEKPAGLERDQ